MFQISINVRMLEGKNTDWQWQNTERTWKIILSAIQGKYSPGAACSHMWRMGSALRQGQAACVPRAWARGRKHNCPSERELKYWESSESCCVCSPVARRWLDTSTEPTEPSCAAWWVRVTNIQDKTWSGLGVRGP